MATLLPLGPLAISRPIGTLLNNRYLPGCSLLSWLFGTPFSLGALLPAPYTPHNQLNSQTNVKLQQSSTMLQVTEFAENCSGPLLRSGDTKADHLLFENYTIALATGIYHFLATILPNGHIRKILMRTEISQKYCIIGRQNAKLWAAGIVFGIMKDNLSPVHLHFQGHVLMAVLVAWQSHL